MLGDLLGREAVGEEGIAFLDTCGGGGVVRALAVGPGVVGAVAARGEDAGMDDAGAEDGGVDRGIDGLELVVKGLGDADDGVFGGAVDAARLGGRVDGDRRDIWRDVRAPREKPPRS